MNNNKRGNVGSSPSETTTIMLEKQRKTIAGKNCKVVQLIAFANETIFADLQILCIFSLEILQSKNEWRPSQRIDVCVNPWSRFHIMRSQAKWEDLLKSTSLIVLLAQIVQVSFRPQSSLVVYTPFLSLFLKPPSINYLSWCFFNKPYLLLCISFSLAPHSTAPPSLFRLPPRTQNHGEGKKNWGRE